eukprot:2635126-Pyramimonas_sp.AAC.1
MPGHPALGCFIWRPEADANCNEQTGLPPWGAMPLLWVTRKWNATWACRRCLVHIWNIAPGVLDQILDRYYDEVYPATPTVRQATTDIPED